MAPGVPAGIPIQHVVLIVKENHTFDNYFGKFPGVEGDPSLPPPPNPLRDPPHAHTNWLKRATRAQRYGYGRADIPAYWAYAQQYTLCDHYFTEIASQSEPNHLCLIAARTPIFDNWTQHRAGIYGYPPVPFDLPSSLPDVLVANGLNWADYRDGTNDSYFRHIANLADSPNNKPVAQFDAAAAAGTLPAVSWMYAGSAYSEHPPDPRGDPDVSAGVQWTVDRVNAVANGPLWGSTVVFITWDDWGGWYDHVEPPDVQDWPDDGTNYANTQFRYGPRVPCLVLSPFAKRGYVSSTFHSHVSLVKFCLRVFNLPALGGFDADPNSLSDDMWDCFDFTQTNPDLTAPNQVPA